MTNTAIPANTATQRLKREMIEEFVTDLDVDVSEEVSSVIEFSPRDPEMKKLDRPVYFLMHKKKMINTTNGMPFTREMGEKAIPAEYTYVTVKGETRTVRLTSLIKQQQAYGKDGNPAGTLRIVEDLYFVSGGHTVPAGNPDVMGFLNMFPTCDTITKNPKYAHLCADMAHPKNVFLRSIPAFYLNDPERNAKVANTEQGNIIDAMALVKGLSGKSLTEFAKKLSLKTDVQAMGLQLYNAEAQKEEILRQKVYQVCNKLPLIVLEIYKLDGKVITNKGEDKISKDDIRTIIGHAFKYNAFNVAPTQSQFNYSNEAIEHTKLIDEKDRMITPFVTQDAHPEQKRPADQFVDELFSYIDTENELLNSQFNRFYEVTSRMKESGLPPRAEDTKSAYAAIFMDWAKKKFPVIK